MIYLVLVYSPAIRLFPVFAATQGERVGWLTPVLAVLPFIGLVFVLQSLFKKEKETNLSDLYVRILGKIPGKILLLLYLVWSMVLLGLYVRYFAERFLSALLPNSPMSFFTITILSVVFYAVRGGIVQFARTIEFLFILFSIIFVILFLLTIPNMKIINLLPVTYYDIWPLTKSTYSFLGIWVYFTLIFFFADRINDKEHIRRFGLKGAIYLVVTTSMLLIQTIGVYGYTVIKRIPLPYFVAVKSISILDTIERIESLALAFWIIVDFAIISVFMFIIISIIKSLFSLSGTKSLVSPVTIFAYIFSCYIAWNRFELENFSKYVGLPLNIAFGFALPFILLLIGKIRKKV